MEAIIRASSLGFVAGFIKLLDLHFQTPGHQRVYREQTSAQDEHHERRKEKGVGIGYIKLSRIGKDGDQRLMIRCPVSPEHIEMPAASR